MTSQAITNPDPIDPEPSTRDRLIEVAGAEFARQSFQGATVRDICRAAGTNIASINYHFGDKAGLYREVLRTAITRFKAGGKLTIPTDGDPEVRLRVFLQVFMDRVTNPQGPAWAPTLMLREMIEPTDALDEVVASMIRPTFFGVAGVIAEMLGRSVQDAVVLRTTASVIAQCVWYRHSAHIAKRLFESTPVAADTAAQRADHIADFSLAAIRAMRASPGAAGPAGGAAC